MYISWLINANSSLFWHNEENLFINIVAIERSLSNDCCMLFNVLYRIDDSDYIERL